MIRTPRPTDVLAYVAFRNQTPDNEAVTTAGGKTIAPTIGALLGGSLALNPRRERWVLVDQGQIVGLVAAKARSGADVWDVDELMAAPAADADRVYARLLEHLCGQAVEDGVQKVFLRLHEESEATIAARQAGFFRYTTEHVYHHADATPPTVALDELSPRRPVDHQALFQLYSAAVPAFVRQVEGLTLQEWRWTDGWNVHPVLWRPVSPRRRDFVVREGSAIVAWLQVDLRARLLRLLVDAREAELARVVLAFGLAHLGSGGPVTLPLREYQAALRPHLEEQGFELVARHALLAKALAIRVPEGKMVPIRAS